MPLGNTLNILRPPGVSTPPIQTGWNEDLVKNLHNVLGEISQQLTTTTTVATASLTHYVTKAELEAATVPALVVSIVLSGHIANGDGGGATYKRVGAEPSHALKIQSTDGAWWEIVPDNGVISAIATGMVEGDTAGLGAANVTAFNNFITYVQTFPATGLYVGGITLSFPIGDYHFSTHLNVKAGIRMLGAAGWDGATTAGAKLHWPVDTYGIIVHRHDTIDDTTEAATFFADGTIIEGLHLKGGGNTETTGSGIWMRGRALIKNCTIREFAEDGIKIVATSGGASNIQGNANLWRIENSTVAQNGRHGLFVDGGDVNAGLCHSLSAEGNGRWGIYDSGFLGDTYIQCHTSANGQGLQGGNPALNSSVVTTSGTRYAANIAASEADLVATTPGTDETVWINHGSGSAGDAYPEWLASQSEGTYFHGGAYHTDNPNGANTFIGCYKEDGQGMNQLRLPTVVYGGFMRRNKGTAIVMTSNVWTGAITFSNQDTHFTKTLRDIDFRINGADYKILTVVAEDDGVGINLVSWDETEKHYMICEHGNSGSRRPIRITSDLSDDKFGRTSDVNGGELLLYKGFFLGVGTSSRHMTGGGTSAPSSGEHGRGDIVWNRNASAGGSAGWICITAGDPGTWKTFGAIAA